jgi:hypothetical protein
MIQISQTKKSKASFHDLTPEQRALITNGLGPAWFPKKCRDWITQKAGWFFQSASWDLHDFCYLRGGSERDRWRCDFGFFRAMLRDIAVQNGRLWVFKSAVAVLLSIILFMLVLLLGSTRFAYGRPKSLEEIIDYLEASHAA